LYLAFDDSRFTWCGKRIRWTTLVGCAFDEKLRITGVRFKLIEVDGLDSSEKIVELAKELRCGASHVIVFLDGLCYAGFNVVDMDVLQASLSVPIISVLTEKPNEEEVRAALRKHFSDWDVRWSILSKCKFEHEILLNEECKPIYVELRGISLEEAKNILARTTVRGRLPEPLRVAKKIAQGLSPINRALFGGRYAL